jgi:uncharacterized protein YjaZ
MAIRLHVLTAGGNLQAWIPRIEAAFDSSRQQVCSLLPISDVDVLVYASNKVIPELGLNGYSDTPWLIRLWFDPNHATLSQSFEKAFLGTFAHELHHCMRARGPGYGKTLGEALITEGLACHFEASVTQAPPFYAIALSAAQLAELRARATRELGSREYNHPAWFFGSKVDGLPRHGGYSLGYAIVGDYLARHQRSAAELWNESAQSFYGTA